MSNILEALIEFPVEHERNVFGAFDGHLKIIEKTLNVTLVSRDGMLKILGAPERVEADTGSGGTCGAAGCGA